MCEKSKNQWERDLKEIDLDELNELNNLLDEVNDNINSKKENLKKDAKKPKIVPHTVSDVDEVTELPGNATIKIDKESKETKETEKPTDKPVTSTVKTEITTKEEKIETKAETEPAVATTITVHEKETVAEETTMLPDSTTRTRRKRKPKKTDEGDVVRKGDDYNYQ